MTFAWIERHCEEFPVQVACETLGVSPSGFYAWLERGPSLRRQRREALMTQIADVHARSRGVYGSPRVHAELKHLHIKVCENTVARLMRECQLRSKRTRRFVPRTTDARHPFPLAPNVLDRAFKADAPNQKWVCDITYIETGEGWLYMAALLDLFSRKIVGWSMSDSMRVELVDDALNMALSRRQPDKGLLHHSDRGVQYACGAYQQRLKQNGITCSMSRTGNCYDNAAMESFWSTLKTELVHHTKFATRSEARKVIFEYVEVFYNRERKHSSLGYLSPEAFEAALN